MNSYILLPLKVTFTPKGIPVMILKVAIDFLAFVTNGCWPAIEANWSEASWITLESFTASPRPMFNETFTNLGSARSFFMERSFFSFGTIVFTYISFKRGV